MLQLNKSLTLDFVMVALALLSVFLLIFEIITDLTLSQAQFIQYFDLFIAITFLGDFFYQLLHAKDKKQFFKSRWWELLAAIPITTQTTQVLRSIMLIRAIPLLETFRFARLAARLRMILELSKKYTKQTYLVYLGLIVGLIILSGAAAFYYFEFPANSTIHSFWDAIWWSITTMSTVGAGDVSITTTGGRIVAIFLIFLGIGALGTFVAAIDTYVIRREEKLS